MTLAVVFASRTAIWACADRQLGDDARATGVKIAVITAVDGAALLTYSGIGRIRGTEVSRWVCRTLCTLDWPLENQLAQILSAAPKELLKIAKERGWGHVFLVGAIREKKPRIYAFGRRRIWEKLGMRYSAVKGVVNGSGEPYATKYEQPRLRHISTLVRQYDRGHVSAEFIAQQLSKLNIAVSARSRREDGISPECIVVQYQTKTINPGARSWMFDSEGNARSLPWGTLPQIVRGQLVTDIGDALWGPLIAHVVDPGSTDDFEKRWRDAIAATRVDMDSRLAKVLKKPDDSFT
jgi:hypothetical protein